MTMKKRFLGLALAAMVAVPATTAYATGSQTVTGNETATMTHSVPVTGSVTKNDGTAADGKITVELPTAMSFAVDKNGVLEGTNFNVENRSSVGIDVFVSEFRKERGTITLENKDFDATQNDRSHVSLVLNGSDGGSPTEVDLANAKGGDGTKVLNVSKQSSGLISLTGKAGTKTDSSPAVETSGATGDFTLVFKVKKDTKG